MARQTLLALLTATAFVSLSGPVLAQMAAPPPARPTVESILARGEAGIVRMHIDADNPGVELHRKLRRGDYAGGEVVLSRRDEVVCIAPCDALVDGRSGTFYFGSKEITPSRTFKLFLASGDVHASVRAGDRSGRTTGIVVAGLGGGLVVIGSVVTALGFIMGPPDQGSQPLVPGGRVLGPIIMGIGATGIISGVVVTVQNRTRLEITPPLIAWHGPLQVTLPGLALRF